MFTGATVADPLPKIDADTLQEQIGNGDPRPVVLDVRTPAEFRGGRVPGAINISHDELAERLDELEGMRDRQIVLYCRSGRRVGIAAELLREQGFETLAHLSGDFGAWARSGHPVEAD
jgi:rhodanese-related sulfurtransferase